MNGYTCEKARICDFMRPVVSQQSLCIKYAGGILQSVSKFPLQGVSSEPPQREEEGFYMKVTFR